MNIIKANLINKKINIAIIVPRFNNFINKNLLEGSLDVLQRIGKVKNKNITIIKIPGSYELPITALSLVKTKKYNAIIVLGTIFKGGTTQYKYIAKEINSNIIRISLKHNIPITMGLLIVKNLKQAIDRSGLKFGNKGSEAALTILEMINLIKIINK